MMIVKTLSLRENQLKAQKVKIDKSDKCIITMLWITTAGLVFLNFATS